MIAFDGNESLKRLARPSTDPTMLESDYFLSPRFVDSLNGDTTLPAQPDQDRMHEHTPQQSSCTDRWKAAAPDSTKKTWGIFDETGIFASACCHGFILWIADMRQGGEKCVD
jgi:hypothetical protein